MHFPHFEPSEARATYIYIYISTRAIAMSVLTLDAARSFLCDQVTQVKTEKDLEELVEASHSCCYLWFRHMCFIYM